MMRTVCFNSFDELGPYAGDWQQLASGVPFRSWTWLSHWWQHYGPPDDSGARRLAVLGVFDDAGGLMGIAPWYLDCSALHGRVLRPLGSGEVCSDYLSVLCHPAAEDAVVQALADYLIESAGNARPDTLRWDLLQLDGVDAADRIVERLGDCLREFDCTIHRRAGPNCWRLELPADWQQYVASLGKNFRRDVRRLERELLGTGRAALHTVTLPGDLPRAMDILVELHQRRRQTLGEGGCYGSRRFLGFYRDVVPAMFGQGGVQFHWLELDGQPVAAEYQLAGDGVLYAYQSGVDPAAMEHQPGKLLNLAILRQAMERGHRAFDFLRGDEPYKARFGAQPRPQSVWRIVGPRSVARFRHGLWLAGSGVKGWVRARVRNGKGKREKEEGRSKASNITECDFNPGDICPPTTIH
jgi:CelD/BcsL family acetyltransferase involved in cellulose biosynthesis